MELNELEIFLKTKGFSVVEKYEGHLGLIKDVDGIPFCYLLVAPHKGTNYKWMFRADAQETHDKWSNCEYERFYDSKEDFKKNWNRYIIFNEQDE